LKTSPNPLWDLYSLTDNGKPPQSVQCWGRCWQRLRPAYKPHSVSPIHTECGSNPATISLGRASRRVSCSLPGAAAGVQPGDEQPPHWQLEAASDRPCLTLLPEGVACPPALLRATVVSYTAFSTLLAGVLPPTEAVCFCGPIRQATRSTQ
jgi:hypothetical protein